MTLRKRVVMLTSLLLPVYALAHAPASAQQGGPSDAESVASAECQVAGSLKSLEVPEASGVAESRRNPGVLWVVSDSPEPQVYAVTPAGEIRGKVTLQGAKAEDWEAVAVGKCDAGSCLYVADIGDNNGKRKTVTVYRVPEPAVGDSMTAPAQRFFAQYPGGGEDAEAIWVTDRREVFIVTKGETKGITIYRFPKTARNGRAARLEEVLHLEGKNAERDAMVTDATLSPDGQWVMMRSNTVLLFYRAADLQAGKRGEVRRFDLKSLGEPQGEGVTIGSDGSLILVGEGPGPNKPSTIASLKCELS